ncbi:flavodoxin family protein [Parabacteroides timonensis]|uniref:flavodoxin family protein n=1 Tax=Parabacteroides timonensis TaxID=1871013 RepID=UPI0011151C13|nr:flavodoxin family protein [Parabacteroides timonensis]
MDRRNFIKAVGMTAGATVLSGMGIAGAAELLNDKTNKKMKITVLTGSPRRNGNTNHLASQFIKGAEEAGHEVFRFDCAHHKISGCIACNACGMDGDCVLNDDFSELRPHLLEADMVVFATPMYYFGFSSQLKAAIDRFYALNGKIKGAAKQSALLMAYADTDPKEAEPMISHYHTLLRYLGWKDRGTVVARGMWPAGAVNGTEYSRRAYELGRNV